MIIGISGGIGSGKSVVSRILRLRGFAVYDCDLEAKRIMDSSQEVLKALNERYGDEVCAPGGPICRGALAQRVFSSDDERLWLNSLVHRLVRDDIERWHAVHAQKGMKICFVESAILASSGLARMCGEVWLVTAAEEVRVARIKERDSLDEDAIRRRIETQAEEEMMLKACGVRVRMIDNSGILPVLPQTLLQE